MTTIQFGGITFDDEATSGFTISSWSGWWDGAPMRVPVNDRPQSDGAFGSSNNYRGARAVTVEGLWVGSDMESAYTALRQLRAMQPRGIPSPFIVSEPFESTSSVVALAGVRGPRELFAPQFTYVFDVVAYDPLRYGSEVSASTGVPVSGGGLLWPLGTTALEYWDWGDSGTSGRVSITNAGTADVWPTISALGGLGEGFVATNVATGETIRFERPIPAGSTVAINQRTGSASIDGQSDVGGFITERGFFTIPAGETHQIQFAGLGAVTGTPQFTVALSPGYL
jgi:hypothetical protein